jgi:hypothetical protein
MDVLTLMELAGKMGGVADSSKAYDEIGLTPKHVERLAADLPEGKSATEFAGIKVFASPFVPDGYGVLRQRGKVVGVLNFVDNTSLLISQPDNDPGAF